MCPCADKLTGLSARRSTGWHAMDWRRLSLRYARLWFSMRHAASDTFRDSLDARLGFCTHLFVFTNCSLVCASCCAHLFCCQWARSCPNPFTTRPRSSRRSRRVSSPTASRSLRGRRNPTIHLVRGRGRETGAWEAVKPPPNHLHLKYKVLGAPDRLKQIQSLWHGPQ